MDCAIRKSWLAILLRCFLNSKRWSQICVFFADTGRHVRSVHAAEELLRALHQDFPELVSEMNPFWDFASSSITRDPTAAGITITLQKISGNVSTQLGMKAGAAAPTIATPTTAAPTGTPTAVPTTAAPTPTVIGGLSALSQAISQKKAVSFAAVPLEPMSPAADADPDPEHVPEPAQSASSCVNSNNSGDNSSPPIKRRATEAAAWDTWWKEHKAIRYKDTNSWAKASAALERLAASMSDSERIGMMPAESSTNGAVDLNDDGTLPSSSWSP